MLVVHAGQRLAPATEARVERLGERLAQRRGGVAQRLLEPARRRSLQRPPGMLLGLEQTRAAARQRLAELRHGQRRAIRAGERLEPARELLPSRPVDRRQEPLLVAVDEELQEHQHHRQAEGCRRRVEGRAQAGDDARDVLQLRGGQAGDGDGDPDHRAQEAHDRNRPDHEPHEAVPLRGAGGVEIGEILDVVLEAVGGPGPDHEIEGLTEPGREVATGRILGRQLLQQRGRLGGILSARGYRGQGRRAERSPLPGNVASLDRQRRQSDAEHRHFDVLDPVPGEVADHGRVGDDAAVNEREEGEGQRAAPQQGRAEQGRGQAVHVHHGMIPPATGQRRELTRRNAASAIIGSPCPGDSIQTSGTTKDRNQAERPGKAGKIGRRRRPCDGRTTSGTEK